MTDPTCTICGHSQSEHELPLKTGACITFSLLKQASPPRSPFPPEVVERAIDAGMKAFDDAPTDMSLSHDEQERAWRRARFNAEFSVIADYLRSEEARERGIAGIRAGAGITYRRAELAFDAVIAALLGELA